MRDRLQGTGVEAVVVTFTSPEMARRYRDAHDLDLPVLVDADRTAYRAYGLERTSLARAWGLRSLRAYVPLVRDRGLRSLRRPTEDTRQLGGDFLVAADGTLAWAHWSTGPDDRPPPERVAQAASSQAP